MLFMNFRRPRFREKVCCVFEPGGRVMLQWSHIELISLHLAGDAKCVILIWG
jgi:hypothetical protein